MMRCDLLGPVAAYGSDGRTIPLGGAMIRGLFARLALSANRVVPVDQLLHDLWDESSTDTGPPALRVQVPRLRSALAPDGGLLVTSRPGYMLAVADEDVDALRCERLVAAAHAQRSGGHAQAADDFRSALCCSWDRHCKGYTAVLRSSGPRLEGLGSPPSRAGCTPSWRAAGTESQSPSWKLDG